MTDATNDKTAKVEIYESADGEAQVDVRFEQETVWLTQAQMTELFGRDQSVISRHIANAINDEEVAEKSNMQKMHIANSDRPVTFYDLDVVISVGYRIKSPQGVQFRRWATQRLREYLVQGYTLNKERKTDEGRGLVEIISRYTQTFLWLQRYDEGLLDDPAGQEGGILPSPTEAMAALTDLKAQLIDRGEATELFAKPRGDGLDSVLGNLEQTVFGEPAYPTIESKAAHLLYFMVKNHPFTDGNKRSGAFLFVDFLHRNNRLLNDKGDMVINNTGLAALTLLVAESDPNQKETLIKLIMNMLSLES